MIRLRPPGSAESIHFRRLRMFLFEAIDQEKYDQQRERQGFERAGNVGLADEHIRLRLRKDDGK